MNYEFARKILSEIYGVPNVEKITDPVLFLKEERMKKSVEEEHLDFSDIYKQLYIQCINNIDNSEKATEEEITKSLLGLYFRKKIDKDDLAEVKRDLRIIKDSDAITYSQKEQSERE